jgi:hypothetical protein
MPIRKPSERLGVEKGVEEDRRRIATSSAWMLGSSNVSIRFHGG